MRRIPALFLLAFVATLAFATPAWAHTELAEAAPGAGASLKQAPDAVALTFTQDVDPRLATVVVRGTAGGLVSTGEATGHGATVRQSLQDLAPGRYDVEWRAAAADGHILRGKYAFRVGAGRAIAPTASGGETERLTPAEQLLAHARGDYNHKNKPSYAISAAERRNQRTQPAPPPAAAAPAPAPTPDNANATIVTLLAAALGVTTVTAVVESVRAHRV